jgi:hypothetical protein
MRVGFTRLALISSLFFFGSFSNEPNVLERADVDNDGKISAFEVRTHIENFFYGSQLFTLEEIDLLIDVYFD